MICSGPGWRCVRAGTGRTRLARDVSRLGQEVSKPQRSLLRGEILFLIHAIPVPQRPPDRLQRRHQVQLKREPQPIPIRHHKRQPATIICRGPGTPPRG